jgi:type IV secretory pathway VirD2 relaxase
MESDLGTKLDWVAIDHYDTAQPHTHLLVRGARDDGKDLVMPRQYISHGIRERAGLASLKWRVFLSKLGDTHDRPTTDIYQRVSA